MLRRKKRHRLGMSNTDPSRFHKSQMKIYAYLVPICLVMLLPMVYIAVSAFKPMDELFAYPPRFYVKNPTLDNFRRLFEVSADTSIPAGRYLFNTLVNTVVIMILDAWIAVCVGFVLSKKTFRGKNTLLQINNMALMFVQTAVAIPTYFVITYTGLKNNFLVGIIPSLVVPTGVFLVKQFIDQLPDALIEAAHIDGASDYQIVRKIIFPLVRPALSTVMLLAFQGAWINTTASTMYLDDETLKTFAYYIGTLTTGGSVMTQGIAAAGALIMLVPNIVLFIVLQSRVMNTMANSGIK